MAQREDSIYMLRHKLLMRTRQFLFKKVFLPIQLISQFQTSVSIKLIKYKGETIYTYTSNGSGFNNGSGSCANIADIIKLSMETSLRQIADNISQSIYGSSQVNEFIKSKK